MASYTLFVVPVCVLWALATATHYYFTVLTCFAFPSVVVPDSVVGTGGALESIEEGLILGTRKAVFATYVVGRVAGTLLAFFIHEVEVPGVEALNTGGSVVVKSGIAALALASFRIVDSVIGALLALECRLVVELLGRTHHALAAVVEGLLGRTVRAGVLAQVV